jgi:hypothetical protein
VLWECLSCTTQYAVDVPRCPHCAATAHRVYDPGNPPPEVDLVDEPVPPVAGEG